MSLLNKLAQRNAKLSAGEYFSFESQSDDDIDGDMIHAHIDEHISDLNESVGDMHEHSAELSRGLGTIGGLSDLVEQTSTAYVNGEMDETAEELYKVSVECVLKTSGVWFDQEIFPSFEDSQFEEHDGETSFKDSSRKEDWRDSAAAGGDKKNPKIQKVKQMIQNLWRWLVDHFGHLKEMVRNYILKFTASAKALTRAAEALEKKAAGLKGEAKNAKVTIPAKFTDYLTENGVDIVSADKIVEENKHLYDSFRKTWSTEFEEILKMEPPKEKDPESYSKALEKMFSEAGKYIVQLENTYKDTPHGVNRVLTNLWVSVKFKKLPSRDNSFTDAILDVNRSDKKSNKEGSTMTIEQIKSTASGVKVAATEIDAIEKDIADIVKRVDEVSKVFRNGAERFGMVFTDTPGGMYDIRSYRQIATSIAGAVQLMNIGLVKTFPEYLRSLQAGLKYADLSAGQYSK